MLNPKVLLSNEGRVNRLTWWLWCIIFPSIILILSQLLYYFPSDNVFAQIIGVVLLSLLFIELIIIIVVSVKRLHDTDKSGLYLVLAAIPLINLLIFYYIGFQKGTIGSNKYGEDPTKSRQNTSTKICPYCAENIKKEAVVCRYCGRELLIVGNEDKSLNVSRIMVKETEQGNNQIPLYEKQLQINKQNQNRIEQIEQTIKTLNNEILMLNLQKHIKVNPSFTALIIFILLSIVVIPFVPTYYKSILLIIIIALIISSAVMIIMRNSFINENIKPILSELEQKKNRIQTLSMEREKLLHK
jgi:uncharacterized membrane protein YhaH (DUF805 family)